MSRIIIEDIPKAKSGKKLSSEKAKIMFKEGNFDSDKQRKYFGFIAGGGKAENGIEINDTGYLQGSSTMNNPMNVIPSNLITTQGMAFPIMANNIPLYPNTGTYQFPTNQVTETPIYTEGQELDLSKAEIEKLKQMGYEFE